MPVKCGKIDFIQMTSRGGRLQCKLSSTPTQRKCFQRVTDEEQLGYGEVKRRKTKKDGGGVRVVGMENKEGSMENTENGMGGGLGQCTF